MKRAAVKRRRFRVFGGLSFAVLGYTVLPAVVASAAIFTTTLVNISNTFSSGNIVMSATTPTSVVCTPATGSITTTNATTCSGDPYPTATLSTTAASAVTTLSATGSLNGTNADVSSPGCGVQYFNEGVNHNWGLPFYGVTYGAAMSKFSSTAAAFDGSTGEGETYTLETAPANFTITGWFNTTHAQGTLIAFSNSQNTTLTVDNDRSLWIDSAGKLVWATATSATTMTELTSTSVVNNGAWNFFAVTIGTTSGDQLYVNGSLQASNAATAAYNYNGYWHLGWGSELDGTPNWTDKPTSAYFNGSLNGVAIFGSQLTAAKITVLNGETTQATYDAQVAADTDAFYWPLDDTGSTPYTGALPTLTAPTQTLADVSGNANTGHVEGTVTVGATGPTTLGGYAISTTGATGSDVYTTNTFTNPAQFSVSGWFKTSSTGSLMGATNVQTDTTPAAWDRVLFIDAAGDLVFGTNSALYESISPTALNNGAWHFVVASYGPAGEELFVDGALVASNSLGTSGQNYAYYWHLNYAYTTSWPNSPGNYNFNGSLAQVALYGTQLSAAQVSTLYGATSPADEEGRVLALSPVSYWPLQDTTASPACALVEVTAQTLVGATTTCIAPAGAGACATPTTGVLANTFATRSMTGPAVGVPVTLTITMKVASAPAVGVAGLHVLFPLVFYEKNSTFSAQLSYPSGVVIL
jgi:hypothetical protein